MLQGAIYDLPGARAEAAASAELLERFDLTAAAGRPAKTYSGGMQRRLDIAMGLLHRPQALFLDEPTTGLDPEARVDMWHEIERLARDEKMTILLTTHYLEEADELAAQVAIVDRGRIVAEGTPEELKSALEGDALHFELAEAGDDRAQRGARRRRRRASPRSRATGGSSGRARATARPRCRRRSRALEAAGLHRRLGDDGAPLARRGLPAPRRPVVPRGRGGGVTRAHPPQLVHHAAQRPARCSASRPGSRSR